MGTVQPHGKARGEDTAPTATGITLIELVVVMAIVSVLLAVVGPSVSAGMDNLVLASEARRVAAAFRLAQTSARNTGARVFATTDETGFHFFKGDQPYQTVNLPRGIQILQPDKSGTIVLMESGQILGADVIELGNRRGRRVQLKIDHAIGLIKLAER